MKVYTNSKMMVYIYRKYKPRQDKTRQYIEKGGKKEGNIKNSKNITRDVTTATTKILQVGK